MGSYWQNSFQCEYHFGIDLNKSAEKRPVNSISRRYFLIPLTCGAALLAGCASMVPEPPQPSAAHLKAEEDPLLPKDIPDIVQQAPFLPPPAPQQQEDLERYTVVVNEVPIRELLFALARDASINVDIDPRIEGIVTINAIDQTLPQILERVGRQVAIRYEFHGPNLIIMPDTPYFRTYKIDYVNMSRDMSSTNTVLTQIATAGVTDIGGIGGGGGTSGGGGNNSTTDVTSVSNHRFWNTLTRNILALLGEVSQGGGGTGETLEMNENVIPNPESGVINIRATERQHQVIQSFIDDVMVNAKRQVLIEATIVEVELSDNYQAGVDWSLIAQNAGFSAGQFFFNNIVDFNRVVDDVSVAGVTPPLFAATYRDPDTDAGRLRITTQLLKQFGDVKVISSPKLMVLNNQTAMLKVVDNVVYFTTEQETNTTQGVVTNTFETTVHTVPVGFVMTVTPQINDGTVVTMNIRPTISRVTQFINDPNPALTVDSPIPQVQVREMESVLKVNSGNIAILGGLMQDTVNRNTDEIPLIGDVPGLGDLFTSRNNEAVKSELVIFLRPVVMYNASIDSDLQRFRPYLSDQNTKQGRAE